MIFIHIVNGILRIRNTNPNTSILIESPIIKVRIAARPALAYACTNAEEFKVDAPSQAFPNLGVGRRQEPRQPEAEPSNSAYEYYYDVSNYSRVGGSHYRHLPSTPLHYPHRSECAQGCSGRYRRCSTL